ncbi:Chitin synthase chs-1 [Caenorhabditis elegans]|uniref:Chitin synthase chs-1 n=1 Tax=Caenorhabditis elegans TaxID=6239 RepID=CHS1_CAEEL|nr:Chitin synthase chs-1 [Caenorhabditis elegans]G5ECD6.1 RecName: Full=Chitin synthase chs-1; AltName: Full=Chitin-UDP acetyl-glucosaminyl transferase chs-1 [Caenorhabditis elegans]AAX62732.1 chitin synthase 1 [Caenorhabditis elegans]CAA96688.2 Chitin synthase chs-1 [Caenorhabditis elegans]|eukprot:NP_492113.2 Chitin synthase chs-1 [Caenorhabditis elegans]
MNDGENYWNAFRSHKRSATDGPTLSPWMVTVLQATKLLLFALCNIVLTLGSVFSKLIVLIMATNIVPRAHLIGKFARKCTKAAVRRTSTTTAGIYLSLLLIQCFPDTINLIRSGIDMWKGQCGQLVKSVVVLESLRAIGLAVLSFHVFPQLDLARCLVLSACFPLVAVLQRSLVAMVSAARTGRSFRNRLGRCFVAIPHVIMFLVLMSSCYVWALFDNKFTAIIALPIGVICTSAGFWESWIDTTHSGTSFDELYRLKYAVRKMNTTTKLIVSLMRIVCTVSVLVSAVYINDHKKLNSSHFVKAFFSFSTRQPHTRLLLLATGIIVLHFVMRGISRFLAALDLHPFSFVHPLSIAPLIAYGYVRYACQSPTCSIARRLARFGLHWVCDQWFQSARGIASPDFYICLIWLLVGCYRGWRLVRQRYFDTNEEIISSMPPVCNGLCIEQSLVVFQHSLNRQEKTMLTEEEDISDENDELRIRNDEVDRVSTVYGCATMWHETETEMRQVLRSILKLDVDHATRMNNKKANELRYRLEGHIFFDDAWEDVEEDGIEKRQPNEYFNMFFDLLNEMTGERLNEEGKMETRILVNTPYGGRLVVKLPSGTLLFVHLKDKKMIRHKKRWSQVMYMYYLLGHRIMDCPLSIEDRQQMADNTFILAIDGDSKFEPDALLRLLHLMNAKSDIGCACGRIHPIGNGIMVWYQKFEYAIAHWFQKAAEHVFGCVLCAPGCFSLFRASALMDDNIMHKYTKTASEPRHYVQYDQGEDRWLSTLLLKQGYRIEYAAASDAETYAPEGFEEFFNQRRRWTPSSIANTVDLLMDYKRASENNDAISYAYIAYQFLVIFFSMLGPAIIFTMLVFAQVAAFELRGSDVMLYNGIPIGFFIVLCFTTESNIQLIYAKYMSIAYAFVMLAVLVATSSQIVLETVLAPTSLFIVTMVGIFFFAACLHPKEFTNIIHGVVFFLMIPSTYVFLTLYSLINLNVITWGTREAVAKATGQKTKKAPMEQFIDRVIDIVKKGFRLISCREKKEHEERREKMEKKMQRMELALRSIESGADVKKILDATEEKEKREEETQTADFPIEENVEKTQKEIQKANRYVWMTSHSLKVCERGKLKSAEKVFWNELINAYLKPIKTTPAEMKAVAEGLASLRNQIAFTILLVNSLLALAIFLIQKHKNVLSIKFSPIKNFRWTKMNEMTGQYEETDEPLKIDPLGMGIVVFLLIILFVQTLGMLLHRLNTMIGAFQEVKNLYEYGVSPVINTKNDDERIMNNARLMINSLGVSTGHAADGYTRHRGEESDTGNVLYKLQKARLAKRMQRSALSTTE